MHGSPPDPSAHNEDFGVLLLDLELNSGYLLISERLDFIFRPTFISDHADFRSSSS